MKDLLSQVNVRILAAGNMYKDVRINSYPLLYHILKTIIGGDQDCRDGGRRTGLLTFVSERAE